jgi:two-component system phosphate regulon response regulator PhoB
MSKYATPSVSEVLDEMSSRELGHIKVFMVEDDQMISDLVITKLTLSGCIPFSTADGSEAIVMAERYAPDVIILDLMLPGMTGEEILKILKSKDTLKDIPVVIFSNKSEETDKKRMIELGADRYFVKAYTDLNELVEELKVLAHKSTV